MSLKNIEKGKKKKVFVEKPNDSSFIYKIFIPIFFRLFKNRHTQKSKLCV